MYPACKPSQARTLALALLLLLAWQSVAAPALAGDPEPTAPAAAAAVEPESPNFLWDVIRNLLNPRELLRVLGRPQYTLAAFVVLNVIVFVETGLLVGFCLPGDSLLVTAGLVCSQAGWSLPLLLLTLCVSAVVGDSVGYYIGYRTGPRIFSRENSLLFHKDHLLKAQQFYERHGGKTIVLARFMPVIRTFAPVVAGVGKMDYRRFVFYNVFGGVGWVCSMILFGYWLPDVLNPPLRLVFGDHFDAVDHVEKVIILVVLVSVAPGFVAWLRHRGQKAALAAQKSAA
jgi:membrane-associated protein